MGIKKILAMAGLAATAVLGGVKSVNAEAPKEMPNKAENSQRVLDGIPTTKEGYFSGDAIRDALDKLPEDTLKKILSSGNYTKESFQNLAKIVSNGNKSVEDTCCLLLASQKDAKDGSLQVQGDVLISLLLATAFLGRLASIKRNSDFKGSAILAGVASCLLAGKMAMSIINSDMTDKEIKASIVKAYEFEYNYITKFGIPNQKYDKRWTTVQSMQISKRMIEMAQKAKGAEK